MLAHLKSRVRRNHVLRVAVLERARVTESRLMKLVIVLKNGRLLKATILVGVVVVTGCRSAEIGCPDILRPGIDLTVIDSVSGVAPSAASVVIAMSESYTDSVSAPLIPPNHYALALGQTGIFNIVVRTPGYSDWSNAGVRVAESVCGQPITVALTAKVRR